MFRTLTPTLAIIAALIVFFLFIRPQYAALQLLEEEIKSYEKATADYEMFQSKIDGFESRRNSVSVVERDRLDMFIPREIDSTQILVDIEALAKKNALLFGNISVDESALRSERSRPESTGIDAPVVPVHVNISFGVVGTYDQFKTFLKQLEQSLTIFEVLSIDVSAKNEGLFYQFAVTIRTYALPAVTS